MKRVSRSLGAFLCLVMVLSITVSVNAFAAGNTIIDISGASEGYFTVNYQDSNPVKMKVGVTFAGKTVYYNYTPNTSASYTFTEGDGTYTISLFRNVSGTSYRRVTYVKANVQLQDELSQYRVSTADATFSETDIVGTKAAELCQGLTDDSAKIAAINNYIAANYTYDRDFAAAVLRGEIKNYTPNTSAVLEADKGICYDFSSLFAAMCRSQGIPCAIAKGYYGTEYHAWNMVHVDGNWVAVDMTAAIARNNVAAETLADCTVSLDNYSGYTF